MAYSVVALHVAAHNCDYYIVKYQCKSLEQLQNLVTQYATRIRRLEEEEKEAQAAGAEPMTAKQRARKITIRLQSASNRCHWLSSTELAVYLLTGDTCWMSHHDVPVFTSKCLFMMHECRRLMEDRSPGLLQATYTNIDAMEFQLQQTKQNTISVRPPDELKASPTQNASIPSVVSSGNLVTDDTNVISHEPLQSTTSHNNNMVTPVSSQVADTQIMVDEANPNDTPSDGAGTDEHSTDGNNSSHDGERQQRKDDSDTEPHTEAGSDVEPLASEKCKEICAAEETACLNDISSTDGEADNEFDDEHTYKPTRLHASTSRFDDWLHRGPLLDSLPFLLYMHHSSSTDATRLSAGKE